MKSGEERAVPSRGSGAYQGFALQNSASMKSGNGHLIFGVTTSAAALGSVTKVSSGAIASLACMPRMPATQLHTDRNE